jgi:hypothetical protein
MSFYKLFILWQWASSLYIYLKSKSLSFKYFKTQIQQYTFVLTGTTATFRGYGFICVLVLAGFVFINFYRKETGFVSELPAAEDPHQVKK